MDRVRYNAVCRYAGDWLAEAMPRARLVDELDDLNASHGVYIVCDALERICYVGSVCRDGQRRGVARRIAEHLREPLKKLTWHTVWVVPLVPGVPMAIVRRVEGAVGADLEPNSGQRLPRI